MNEHSNLFWRDIGLSEDDTHLLDAVECLPQPAWIFDRDGRYVAQSRSDREAHGNLVGLLPTEARVGPEEGRRWMRFHQRVIAGEQFHHMRALETSRGIVHSETAVSPLWHRGRIVGGIGISVDQTRRVEAEAANRRAQDRLMDFLRISSDWAWETDAEHRFTLVLGDKTKVGVDFDAWIGRTRWELVGADPQTEEPWRTYHDLVQNRRPITDFVYRLIGCSGEDVWIEVNAVPMFDGEGAFTGYRGVGRDVTERERLHQILRRSDLVIRATGNMIILSDRDGLIEWVNPAFTQLTGYTLEEAIGQRGCDLLLCEETDPQTAAAIGRAMIEGHEIKTPFLSRTKTGERHWFDLHLRPLRDAAGEVTGYLGHQSVITDLVSVQQRLSATIEGMAAGMLRYNAAGLVVECNPEACRLLALDEETIVGAAPWHARWRVLDREGTPLPWDQIPAARVLATGTPIRDEVVGVRVKDGSIRWLRVNAHRSTAGTQAAADVITSFIDITGDEEQKRELDRARRLLQDVMDAVPDAISAFDEDGRLILCNEAYLEIYAPARDKIRTGMPFEDILRHGIAAGIFVEAGTTAEQQERWLAMRLASHRSGNTAPSLQQLSDGRWLQVRERQSDSGVRVSVRSDITALKTAELSIRRMAETDSLTGLLDRSVMMREVAATLRQPAASHERALYVMLDLDHFKAINDTLGHDGGDQLLCVLANRLRRHTRKSDMVARLGGDEFAVLLCARGDGSDDEAQIARLHKTLSARVSINGRSFRPGISMGVTRLPVDGPSPRDLVKNADIALYRSKARGRNGWTFFEPSMRESFERRRSLADRLRRAIAGRQITLDYEPWKRLSDGAIIGFEAKPHLVHDGELIRQEALMEAAEEAGLSQRLAESTLDLACAAIAATLAAGGDPGVVAINLTRDPLCEPGFAGVVRERLQHHAICPHHLAFEIAECALQETEEGEVEVALAELEALGVGLLLDEFGRSSAALSHLKRVGMASRLKLHATLVEAMNDSPADAAILRSVIGLAHDLGLEVMADGISEGPELEQLRRLGCDLVQGAAAGQARPAPVLERS